MKNHYKNPLQPIAKLYCATFGHHFRVSNKITDHISEYQCTRCKEERTTAANGFLERLTPKFRETNAYLAEIYRRRLGRKVLQQAS